MKPDVLIVGTGALATLFAARLGLAGAKVGLLGNWQAAIETFNTTGARLLLPNGAELRAPVFASNQPRDFFGAEAAIVLVKTWQTERAAGQLAECMAKDGVALSLQNGLGNYETLREALGTEVAALGITTLGATLLGPGVAKLGGEGPVSVETHPRLGPLTGLLAESGFSVESIPNLDSLRWGKLVINCAINPLTALLRVPNGVLLERPAARELMGELARETARVAALRGVELPFPDPAAQTEMVAQRTAANQSSMLQDLLRGSPTEVDAINGAVARLGREAAPLNRLMFQLVRAAGG